MPQKLGNLQANNLKHPAPAYRAGLSLSGCKAGGTRLSRPFAPLTLPQNTQNGLRPSQNTQKYWGCREGFEGQEGFEGVE